jgi:hypothetical protein
MSRYLTANSLDWRADEIWWFKLTELRHYAAGQKVAGSRPDEENF